MCQPAARVAEGTVTGNALTCRRLCVRCPAAARFVLSRSPVVRPFVALLLLAGSASLRAETRGWVLCMPGALRACHSVQVVTAPVLTGPVRSGTALALALRNLQVPHAIGRWGWSRLADPHLHAGGVTSRVPLVFGLPRVAPHEGGPWQYFDGSGMVTLNGVFSYPAGWVEGCAPSASPSLGTCGGKIVFDAMPTVFDSTEPNPAAFRP